MREHSSTRCDEAIALSQTILFEHNVREVDVIAESSAEGFKMESDCKRRVVEDIILRSIFVFQIVFQIGQESALAPSISGTFHVFQAVVIAPRTKHMPQIVQTTRLT